MLAYKPDSASAEGIFDKNYPSQLSRHKKRTIAPFRSPSVKARSRKSNITSMISYQTMSDEQFSQMLDIPEPRNNEPSLLGLSLYECSLDLRPLSDALNQLLNFRINAPLKMYSYASLIDLINASVKCLPDATLYLLLIAKDMVLLGNYAKPVFLRRLVRITEYFIEKKYFYCSFGDDQVRPQLKLKKILKVLLGEIRSGKVKGKEGTCNTRAIEALMSKNRRQNELRLKMELERRKMGHKRLRRRRLFQNNLGDDRSYNETYSFASCHSQSIEEFLLSKDDIFQRKAKGSKMYFDLTPDQIRLICNLAKLFNSMDTIYSATQIVWNVMKTDETFNVDILLSQIQTSYGDFLIEALKCYADLEGIIIRHIESPR